MNNCIKCGYELQEDSEFCPKCGKKQSKKGKKLPFIIAIIILILVAAAVALYFIVLKPDEKHVEVFNITSDSASVVEGSKIKIAYTIEPVEFSEKVVTWTSNDSTIAKVSEDGIVLGVDVGKCTVTGTVDGKSDEIIIVVKSAAKSNISKAYSLYCKPSFAECAADGSYLIIDSSPDDNGLSSYFFDALDAIEDVNAYLKLPSSLNSMIDNTRALDGIRTQVYGDITVSWFYHPDTGVEVTYRAN